MARGTRPGGAPAARRFFSGRFVRMMKSSVSTTIPNVPPTRLAASCVCGPHAIPFAAVKKAEGEIPSKYWKTPTTANAQAFNTQLRKYRKDLMDKGSYNAKVLAMLKKARCGADAARPECADAGQY